MFFVLSKISYFFIHPFTWLFIGLLIYLISKKNRIKKIAKWISLFCIIFFSNTFIFKEFVRIWEVESIPIDNINDFDVAIVLGGMFEFDQYSNRLSARRESDRLWQTLNLYHKGKVGKIIISGDHAYLSDRGLHEAIQISELLISWGIKSTDIICEKTSMNTHENAVECAKIIHQQYPHFEKILLVTSSYHMKRANACFNKENLNCLGYATDQYTNGKRHYNWDEFIIPNVDNFSHWFVLLKEWIGYLTYWIVGYL